MKYKQSTAYGQDVLISRRRFVAGTLAALAAPAVVPASALGLDNKLAPSERITIGMLGMGNRGMNSWEMMKPLPDHQVLAIAECRRDRAQLAQQSINSFYATRIGRQQYKGCAIYSDFRDLLARKDIDVVWGCVPDHWHGVMYSRAIEAGKDIYGEKPLTRWIAEGVKVRDAVRRCGCVFQTGTMQRSWAIFSQACELAINGYLGKVHTIEVGGPGEVNKHDVEPPCDPPEGFDYDMWTGPAPYIPFDKKRCEWVAMYLISHYCGGWITNWGVHYLDIAGWGCPEVFEKPFEVEGTGGLPDGGMTDTWTWWKAELRWASGLKMRYTSIPAEGNVEMGCKFIGDQGWVRVERGGIWAEPASLLTVRLKPGDKQLRRNWGDNAEPGYTSHTADFFHCVRTRQDPVSPVESGHAASTLGNVADVCLRLGRKVKWDPTQDVFVNDDEANAMRFRPTRSPWTI